MKKEQLLDNSKKLLLGLIVYFILLIPQAFSLLNGQNKKNSLGDAEDADFLFKYQNYRDAIPIYLELHDKTPDNYLYNYRLGICYLNSNLNKAQALKYLKNCHVKNKNDLELNFMLGRAFHLNLQLDSAVFYYNKFREFSGKKKNNLIKADQGIKQAENAKELIKRPVKVHFTNLGPNVNTEYPDYVPWVTSDERKVFFTSRRKDLHAREIETDGYFASDIYYAEFINSKWEKAKILPGSGINTNLDEEIVGMRPDGDELIIYKDHIKDYGDLYYSLRHHNNYTVPKKYEPKINAELEFSGSISEDDQTLFFVRKSNLKNNNQDIYYCRRLPNGKWGLPTSAGEKINTNFNEDFPYLAMDGKTLYFSSEGHNSMGGFDLFKCIWDNETNTFSEPENLGYPINTSDDEKNISILPDNRAGYISAVRKEGIGDLDIYRIKFEEKEDPITIIKVDVVYSDSNSCSNYNTWIKIQRKNDKKIIGQYKPDQITGKCIFALTPGKYDVFIESEDYESIYESIDIPEVAATAHEEKKKYLLKKY